MMKSRRSTSPTCYARPDPQCHDAQMALAGGGSRAAIAPSSVIIDLVDAAVVQSLGGRGSEVAMLAPAAPKQDDVGTAKVPRRQGG